jgi:predicted PurR-regulated permease PerM
LCRRGLKRGLAVGVVVLVGLVLTGLFLLQVVPLIVSESSQVTHQLPHFLRELQSKNSAIGRLNVKYKLEAKAKKLVSVNAFGGALHIGGVVLGLAASVLIILILVIYFLASLPQLKEVFYRLFPRSRRPRVGLI